MPDRRRFQFANMFTPRGGPATGATATAVATPRNGSATPGGRGGGSTPGATPKTAKSEPNVQRGGAIASSKVAPAKSEPPKGGARAPVPPRFNSDEITPPSRGGLTRMSANSGTAAALDSRYNSTKADVTLPGEPSLPIASKKTRADRKLTDLVRSPDMSRDENSDGSHRSAASSRSLPCWNRSESSRSRAFARSPSCPSDHSGSDAGRLDLEGLKNEPSPHSVIQSGNHVRWINSGLDGRVGSRPGSPGGASSPQRKGASRNVSRQQSKATGAAPLLARDGTPLSTRCAIRHNSLHSSVSAQPSLTARDATRNREAETHGPWTTSSRSVGSARGMFRGESQDDNHHQGGHKDFFKAGARPSMEMDAPDLLPLDVIQSEVSGLASDMEPTASLSVSELMHDIDANNRPDPGPAAQRRSGRTNTIMSLRSTGSRASSAIGVEEDSPGLVQTDTRQTLFSDSNQSSKTARRTSREIDDEFAHILDMMPTSRSPSRAPTQDGLVSMRPPDKKLSTASTLRKKKTKESDDWDAMEQLNRFAVGAEDVGESPVGPAAPASSSSFANQTDKLRDRMMAVRNSSSAFHKMVKKEKKGNRESDGDEKPGGGGNDSDSGESLWGDNTNSSSASDDDWRQLQVQLDS